jgi:hypothetical protein
MYEKLLPVNMNRKNTYDQNSPLPGKPPMTQEPLVDRNHDDTMDFFRPCNSPADIVSDLHSLSDRLGRKSLDALYDYARRTELHNTPIVRPPLLSLLPPCIPVSLDSTRNSTLHIASESFIPADGLMPVKGFDEIRRMVDFKELPGLLRNQDDLDAWVKRITGKPGVSGIYGLHFYQRLKHEAYLYMKSGKTGLPLAEIRHAIMLYTALEAENSDIRQTLADAGSPEDIPAQNALAELVFSRVPRFLQSLSWLDITKICSAAKFKLQAMALSGKAKIAVTHEINSLSTMEQFAEFAEKKLPALLDAMRADPKTVKKACDLLSSYRHEAERLPELYKAWFMPKNLEVHFVRYRPRKLGIATTKYEKQVHSVTRQHALRLYPKKDLLEYVKGKISGDCSRSDDLAAKHIQTPEFFNLRVVSNERWSGNIYCLDLSGTHQCCIIDKVQVPGMFEKKEWNNFFSNVTQRLANACGSVKLLLPDSDISNENAVCEAFNKYTKSLKVRFYEPNRFKCSRFKSFESVANSKRFMVV